jgi:hypothetical protein
VCHYVLHCISPSAAAQDYNLVVEARERARSEIVLWAYDLRNLPVMPLTPRVRQPGFRLDADASEAAAAAIFTDLTSGFEIGCIHHELSADKRGKSSTQRELLGYASAVRVIRELHGARLRGCLAEIVGDSQAAGAIFRKGGSLRADLISGEREPYEALLGNMNTAADIGFSVVFRWNLESSVDFTLEPASSAASPSTADGKSCAP